MQTKYSFFFSFLFFKPTSKTRADISVSWQYFHDVSANIEKKKKKNFHLMLFKSQASLFCVFFALVSQLFLDSLFLSQQWGTRVLSK